MFCLSNAPRAKKESFVAEIGWVPLRYVPRPKTAECPECSLVECKARCLRHLEIGLKYVAVTRSLIVFVKNKMFISENYSRIQNTRRMAERKCQKFSHLGKFCQLLR